MGKGEGDDGFTQNKNYHEIWVVFVQSDATKPAVLLRFLAHVPVSESAPLLEYRCTESLL